MFSNPAIEAFLSVGALQFAGKLDCGSVLKGRGLAVP